LTSVAVKAINNCEKNFKVKVCSFVTDNTGNVKLMRKNLEELEELNIIQYGCNAHILNLLSHDLEIPNVQANILKIIKYFKNKHLPPAWYKKANGKKLISRVEVRWSTVAI